MNIEDELHVQVEIIQQRIRQMLEAIVEYLSKKGISEEMAINLILDIGEDMLSNAEIESDQRG